MNNLVQQDQGWAALHPLAAVLYQERKRQSLSQEELRRRVKKAAKTDDQESGASRFAISRWESGRVTPQPDSLRWLAVALNLDPDYLVTLADRQRGHGAQLPNVEIALARVHDGLSGEEAYLMLRRQFLHQILGMAGLTFMQPMQLARPVWHEAPSDMEEFIHQCRGNVDSCWRLLRGPDIMVVPSVLAVWLPLLDVAVKQSSYRREDLARLAAEGWLIAGLVAVLQGRHDRSEWCCKQAHEYALLTGDLDLQVAALKHLATKYQSAGYPLLHLRTYEEALPLTPHASPLLRSRTYLGLALAHAECGNEAEAARNLIRAEDTFPQQPENDPTFGYADCGRSSLNHYGGLIRIKFGKPREAWETFAATMTQDRRSVVPERTVIEINNCQAEAAIAGRDLDLACHHVTVGLEGARRLSSDKRLEDSVSLLRRLSAAWPNEKRVQQLQAQLNE